MALFCCEATIILKQYINNLCFLLNKGFRIPEDLLDEGEEGESQTLGGMGLGEGEGEKDVSDQIESQDQLEDAKPAGQEKEEEDKECKVIYKL